MTKDIKDEIIERQNNLINLLYEIVFTTKEFNYRKEEIQKIQEEIKKLKQLKIEG